MRSFRNKRFEVSIIAIAWAMVYSPLVVNAAEQQFKGIQAIALGPQPIALTLKTAPRKDIAVDIDPGHPAAAYAEWSVQPEGTLRLRINQAEISTSALPVTVTLPEGWSGQLQCLGSGHKLKGENLKLKRWQIELVGGELDVEWSGSVEELQANVTGMVHWRAAQLKVGTLVWNGSGEGDVRLNAVDRLTGRLVGRFQLDYTGNPPAFSMSNVGQSRVRQERATP